MQTLHNPSDFSFASDNYSGIHPRVLAALAAANGGHQPAYGADVYTERLEQRIKHLFGEQAECFPVFNGTGANVLSLQALLPRYGAVVCADSAHIHNDEGVAPEYVAGIKILAVATPDGKLTPALIDRQSWGWGDEHRAQPRAVYISQSTELGTCYNVAEIRAIAEHCHQYGMLLYLDGARLSNAAAHLGVSLCEMTTAAGVDMLSFGGTKNGIMLGECVVVLNPSLVGSMRYLRKINMQLGSKMRFISAQFLELLENDLWLQLAQHSNSMAELLHQAVCAIEAVQITQVRQSNAVFVILPAVAVARLRRQFHFYDWNARSGEVRWMTGFDTTPQQVDTFAAAIRAACNEPA